MTYTRPICTIVPPHILRQLAGDDDEPRVARAARRTLARVDVIVTRREVRSARLSRRDPGGVGLIPPDLRRRARPDLTLDQVPERAAALPATFTPNRTIYDAGQGTDLPGQQVRAEGDPPSQDESVNEAYDGLGSTFELFAEVYQRNSLDGDGLPLLATVHYDRDFDNAYWDGEQMVFGDGDGVYFSSFTDSIDVIGHELTHGFTQYTAGLTYVAQPGALNESLSDVFGSLVKQRVASQTADEADWLIGQGLFTDKVQGVALRSMKAPGTAYDDPHLGKDPQPATMDDYQELPHTNEGDNGGVHINSGIPNHAFYLAATRIGGEAWKSAGAVWYDTAVGGKLPKDSDFVTFAHATVAAARARFGEGADEVGAIESAWRDVKVFD